MPLRATSLAPWTHRLADPQARAALGRALQPLLTPEVTARLPASLAFDQDRDSIDAWIDAVDSLADVHTITRTDSGVLAGLLLLFTPESGPETERETGPEAGPAADDSADLMVGYFLGPAHWGQRLATDMLTGLIETLDRGPARRLFAGTDADNFASQRVLENAGFTKVRDDTTPGRIAFARRCGR